MTGLADVHLADQIWNCFIHLLSTPLLLDGYYYCDYFSVILLLLCSSLPFSVAFDQKETTCRVEQGRLGK